MNKWVVKAFTVREKIALDRSADATLMGGSAGTKGGAVSLLGDSDSCIQLFPLKCPLIPDLVTLWTMYPLR